MTLDLNPRGGVRSGSKFKMIDLDLNVVQDGDFRSKSVILNWMRGNEHKYGPNQTTYKFKMIDLDINQGQDGNFRSKWVYLKWTKNVTVIVEQMREY